MPPLCEEEEMKESFRITLLGTAHGNPTFCRFNTSTLVESGGEGMLIDAGTPALALLVRIGYDLRQLRHIYLTHMHEDHYGGLPDLIKYQAKYSTYGTLIHLPEEAGIKGMLDFMALAHRPVPSDKVSFTVVGPGEETLPNGVTIRAIPTEHCWCEEEKRHYPSFAYLLTAPSGRRIFISGDLACDFHDFPEGIEADIAFCELTHYPIDRAFPVFRRQPYGKLVFIHVNDAWHDAGAEARLAEWLDIYTGRALIEQLRIVKAIVIAKL